MNNLIKLCDVKVGEVVVLHQILGVENRLHKRLVELGFVKGSKILVIKKSKDVLLVSVREVAFGIDSSLAKFINVWECEL